MSFRLFLFLLPMLAGLNAAGQDQGLPADIESFYRDKNFVNTYTLREERVTIFTLLQKNTDLSTLKDERMVRAVTLLQNLSEKFIPATDNMHTGSAYPFQLVLPEINQVIEWKRDGNRIQVSLYTYSMEPEQNRYYVASYTPEKEPENTDPVDFSKLRYASQEVHDWIDMEDGWHKTSLNKILVK